MTFQKKVPFPDTKLKKRAKDVGGLISKGD